MAFNIFIRNSKNKDMEEKVNRNFDTYSEAIQFIHEKLMPKIKKYNPDAILFDVYDRKLQYNCVKYVLYQDAASSLDRYYIIIC